MSDLAAIVQRLRFVKETTRRFLTLSALKPLRDSARHGRLGVDEVDTAEIKAAIMELDVYGHPSLVRSVLDEK